MARYRLNYPIPGLGERVTKKAAVVRDNARYPLVTSDVSRAKHHTRQHALTDNTTGEEVLQRYTTSHII